MSLTTTKQDRDLEFIITCYLLRQPHVRRMLERKLTKPLPTHFSLALLAALTGTHINTISNLEQSAFRKFRANPHIEAHHKNNHQ